MEFGDVIDQLGNQHGFTHTGTGKQASLTTLSEWGDEVNHLNTSFEDLGLIRLLC